MFKSDLWNGRRRIEITLLNCVFIGKKRFLNWLDSKLISYVHTALGNGRSSDHFKGNVSANACK